MLPPTLPSLLLLLLFAPAESFVDVDARFAAPAKSGGTGAVVVSLVPRQPAIVVNEKPAPRLALDPEQSVLIDRQPPTKTGTQAADAPQTEYRDPKVPVRFPVALAADAPAGTHTIKGVVTYFFCSKAEGWCRKGKAEIAFEVIVP